MTTYLWIAFGGALGSMARFASAEWMQARWSAAFPWGTLFVNVLGCLAIGMLAALSESGRWHLSLIARQFLMIGVLGGFTTFSSFSLQTLMLMRSGALLSAGLNVLASVALCLFAAWCGFTLISALARV
ncbi:MAG: fluoride efflux transporter CrcB [Steroidobacteraceae bacterium]